MSDTQAKAAALPAGARIPAGTSKSKQGANDPRIVPAGSGGLPGKVFRCLVHVCTGGFAYPNVWIEGMDLMEKHRRDTHER